MRVSGNLLFTTGLVLQGIVAQEIVTVYRYHDIVATVVVSQYCACHTEMVLPSQDIAGNSRTKPEGDTKTFNPDRSNQGNIINGESDRDTADIGNGFGEAATNKSVAQPGTGGKVPVPASIETVTGTQVDELPKSTTTMPGRTSDLPPVTTRTISSSSYVWFNRTTSSQMSSESSSSLQSEGTSIGSDLRSSLSSTSASFSNTLASSASLPQSTLSSQTTGNVLATSMSLSMSNKPSTTSARTTSDFSTNSTSLATPTRSLSSSTNSTSTSVTSTSSGSPLPTSFFVRVTNPSSASSGYVANDLDEDGKYYTLTRSNTSALVVRMSAPEMVVGKQFALLVDSDTPTEYAAFGSVAGLGNLYPVTDLQKDMANYAYLANIDLMGGTGQSMSQALSQAKSESEIWYLKPQSEGQPLELGMRWTNADNSTVPVVLTGTNEADTTLGPGSETQPLVVSLVPIHS